MAAPWPLVLTPRTSVWGKILTSRSGGPSLSGRELVVQSDAGRWRAELTIQAAGPMREEKVLALRALSAQLQGRAGEVLVPCMDVYRPRNGQGRVVGGHHAAPLGDGLLWDLSGFGQTEPIYAEAAGLTPLGATQMAITVLEGEGLRPGQYFGVGERLYVVSRSYREFPEGPQIVHFWPRLRSACASGTQILLGTMVCTMRLAADDGDALALEMLRHGTVTLAFEEAL